MAGFIGSPSMNFVHGRIALDAAGRHFLSDGGLRLPLPETAVVADGQSVTYGIRPEHISVGPGGVAVKVVVLEPTGSETQIFARAGGDLIDAIVKDRISARPGDEIGYHIDVTRVHLFDRVSEQRI